MGTSSWTNGGFLSWFYHQKRFCQQDPTNIFYMDAWIFEFSQYEGSASTLHETWGTWWQAMTCSWIYHHFFDFFLRKRGLTRPKTYQPGPTIVQMGGSSLIDTYHWIGDISNFSGWAFTNTHFTRKTNNETPPKPSDSSRFQTRGPLFFSDMGCPWSQMLGSKASAKCSTSMDQESIRENIATVRLLGLSWYTCYILLLDQDWQKKTSTFQKPSPTSSARNLIKSNQIYLDSIKKSPTWHNMDVSEDAHQTSGQIRITATRS